MNDLNTFAGQLLEALPHDIRKAIFHAYLRNSKAAGVDLPTLMKGTEYEEAPTGATMQDCLQEAREKAGSPYAFCRAVIEMESDQLFDTVVREYRMDLAIEITSQHELFGIVDDCIDSLSPLDAAKLIEHVASMFLSLHREKLQ